MNVNTRTRRGEHVSPKAGLCHFKSSWELAYMLHLDAADHVTSWSYESIRVPYERNGKPRSYFPDFFVHYADGHRELIEIKPRAYARHPSVQIKAHAARVWCESNRAAYGILTERELIADGVLPRSVLRDLKRLRQSEQSRPVGKSKRRAKRSRVVPPVAPNPPGRYRIPSLVFPLNPRPRDAAEPSPATSDDAREMELAEMSAHMRSI